MSNQKLPILFVDDDPIFHKLIERYLRDWDVEYVYSGEEALIALKKRNFVIVITDLRMPGIHGLKLLEEIKRTYGNRVKVVVVTVSDEEEDLLSALDRGASDFLLKPIKKAELYEVLGQLASRISRWIKAMNALAKKQKMDTQMAS